MMYCVTMMIRTQILLPKDLLSDLRFIAAERGWSVSRIVREMVKDKIRKAGKGKKSGAEAMLEMARWAKENKVKGPRDLSVNDEYLYGKLPPGYPKSKK